MEKESSWCHLNHDGLNWDNEYPIFHYKTQRYISMDQCNVVQSQYIFSNGALATMKSIIFEIECLWKVDMFWYQ